MNVSRVKLIETLQNAFPFNELDNDQVDYLVGKIKIVQFQTHKMIYFKGTPAQYLYLIFQGEVEILKEKNSSPFRLNTIRAQFTFGEDIFSNNRTRYTSARALSDVILIKIDHEIVTSLCEMNHAFKMDYRSLVDSYHNLCRKRENDSKNEETIFYIEDQHPILIISKIILSLITIFSLGIVIVSLFNSGLFSYLTLLWIGGVLAAAEAVWILWQYIDWKNHYFYFTDKRIIIRRRSYLAFETRQETHLAAIKSVQIQKSFIGRLFNFGNLDIKTFTGSMRLPLVPQIDCAQKMLNYLFGRSKKIQRDEERRSFEGNIRERLFDRQVEVKSEGDRLSNQEKINKNTSSKSDLEIRKLKEHDEVIFHKHWTILFAKIFIPISLLLGLVSLYLYLVINRLEISKNVPFTLVLSGCIVILFLWAAYRYSDWKNDVYIIADDHLVDLHRNPFGMEDKRSAPIENVQSIRYKKNGVLGLLLNFGTVFTRIGDEEFTFDNVHQPAKVQEMIFSTIEQFDQKHKNAQMLEQEERAVDWLDSYHQIMREKHNGKESGQSKDDRP